VSPIATDLVSRLRERATGMQRPEEFMRKPGIVELSERKTGETRPHTLDRNEEYELSLTVGCRYWANSVQREGQRRNAERMLARLLYQDVLAELSAIRHAIYDGEKHGALDRICALEARLGE
jgi:hypothetical protein